MNKVKERLLNGLIHENPTFVLMLGMCPTLAVTTSAINGLGMGLTTMVVLALSNLMISCLRKIIPDRVRIPAFIVIIASFVTVVQLLLEAYLPSLNDSLGVYIPLIVVNCIILGRAESYASSNPPIPSLFDGIGMGLGFTFALTLIGMFRELLGAGTLFDLQVMPEGFTPIGIFVMAPGAFFVLACLTAIQNYVKAQREKAGKDASKIGSGCSQDCMNCGDSSCSVRFYDEKSKAEDKDDETFKGEQKAEKPTKEEEKVGKPSKEEEKAEKTSKSKNKEDVPVQNRNTNSKNQKKKNKKNKKEENK